MQIDITRLTPTDKTSLLRLGKQAQTVQVWYVPDLVEGYRLFSLLINEQRTDSGCSGCRVEMMNHLKEAYNIMMNNERHPNQQ